jgi:hypothetical protein
MNKQEIIDAIIEAFKDKPIKAFVESSDEFEDVTISLNELTDRASAIADKVISPNALYSVWWTDDIKSRDESLTEEECRLILHIVEHSHDATIGINWDTIDNAIDEYRSDPEGWKAWLKNKELAVGNTH